MGDDGKSANATGPGLYLYCFARPLVPHLDISGIEGEPDVDALTIDSVTAVWSPVPLDAFMGPTGEANLGDSSWVVPRACQHERVVEAVMRHSPVLPVRFGAVFSTPQALKKRVTDWATEISQFLDHVTGKEEWSVKGFVDQDRLAEWLTSTDPLLASLRQQAPPSVGGRYLHEKRLHVALRDAQRAWCQAVTNDLAESLSDHNAEVRPLSSRLTNRSKEQGGMVLNHAVLVSKDWLAEFRTRVEDIERQYAGPGLRLEVSGPWPPYSFCPSALCGRTGE